MTDYSDIENSIKAEALVQSFGDTVIDDDPLIVEAARVLLSDWKPLVLANSNNEQANYATGLIVHVPAKRLADY